MLESILKKAESCISLENDEVLELLAIPNGSRAYYELLGIANRCAHRRFCDTGCLFAQIGINASPCPANCAFCSLARDAFDPKNSFSLPIGEIEQIVTRLLGTGIDEVFLMTTADYDREQYLRVGAAVRKILPDGMRLVANVGDFDSAYGRELVQTGFTGAYHIRRLGEGTDTLLDPALRVRTLDAIRATGLELYYCVEPIGPEHSYQEIADEIFRGRDYKADVMAVMKRVCVPNTRLCERGEISAAELAKICAVTGLCVLPERAMGVHEPDELCLMAGANQLYAEVSVNPRDVSLRTEKSRGASSERAARMLRNAEWRCC